MPASGRSQRMLAASQGLRDVGENQEQTAR